MQDKLKITYVNMVSGAKYRKNIIDLIFSALVIMLPFLYQYKGISKNISLGETILIPFILLYAVLQIINRKSQIDVFLLVFYLVCILTSVINSFFLYFSMADFFSTLMRLVYYGILIMVARKHFELKYIQHFYETVTILLTLYLLIQYIYRSYTGNYLPIYLNHNWLFEPESRNIDLAEIYKWSFRPSSLFLEPSYFVMFTLPFLSLKTFQKKKKAIDWITIALLALSYFLSSSNSGIAAIMIAVVLYVYKKILSKPFKQKRIFAIIVLLITIIGLWFIINNEDFSMFERFRSGGSFNYRVTRGVILFSQLDLFHKIIGVGLNNIEAYMYANRLTTLYDEGNLNYMSTALQVINSMGLIGLISFCLYLLQLRKKITGDRALIFFFILLFVICYESILFSYRFGFLIIILESLGREGTQHMDRMYLEIAK